MNESKFLGNSLRVLAEKEARNPGYVMREMVRVKEGYFKDGDYQSRLDG